VPQIGTKTLRGELYLMHTLVLLGELDRASTATLEAAIEGLCEREVDGIVLDLSELSYIDATGVAVVAFRCHWCQKRGYEFALVPGSPAVQRVFELSGASTRLPFLTRGPAAQTLSADESSLPAGASPSAIACARRTSRGKGQLPAVSRPRSVTLLRVSGQRAKDRRARRARERS
jgi:anti-anti-sigma factor